MPAGVVPDTPTSRDGDGASAFGSALDSLGGSLAEAQGAEDAFARNAGSLADAVYDRARADVALSVATAAAQRCAQAISSITNMQV
jgi:flagellar hook-basal body complex protein FliE